MTSLPSFPPSAAIDPNEPPQSRNRIGRYREGFITLMKMTVLAAVLVWTWQIRNELQQSREAERRKIAAASRPPRDFRIVTERFGQLRSGETRSEVEQLLGRPTERTAWGPEIAEYEEKRSNSGRNFFPDDREWNRWTDPANPDRWAAILYTVGPNGHELFGKVKKGF